MAAAVIPLISALGARGRALVQQARFELGRYLVSVPTDRSSPILNAPIAALRLRPQANLQRNMAAVATRLPMATGAPATAGHRPEL